MGSDSEYTHAHKLELTIYQPNDPSSNDLSNKIRALSGSERQKQGRHEWRNWWRHLYMIVGAQQRQ